MKKLFVPIFVILLPLFASAQFSSDLYFGRRNDSEVSRLQEFLRGQGHFTYPEITGNFFTATRAAVIRFQLAQNIYPPAGYFGPLTRAVANRLITAAAPAPIVPSQTPIPPVGPSSYKDKIRINYVSGYSETPEFESIVIENRSSKENISITDFAIESDKARFVIPKGYHLPGFSASPQDPIILKSGGRAIITVGRQARMMDFRENLCTGYFSEMSNFTPSLSHSCPRPDTKGLLFLSDQCLRVIESTPTCRMADSQQIFESSCSEFVNQNLNYVGCVRNYQARSDFFSGQWLVWMQRKEEFFRNTHDKVILKDPQGRAVDEYSY